MTTESASRTFGFHNAFAQRLRVALAVSGRTRGDMAAACGVSRAAVHNWLTGASFPTSRNLCTAAELTGASIEWLMSPHEIDIRSTQHALDGKHIKDLMREVVREYFASVAGPDA